MCNYWHSPFLLQVGMSRMWGVSLSSRPWCKFNIEKDGKKLYYLCCICSYIWTLSKWARFIGLPLFMRPTTNAITILVCGGPTHLILSWSYQGFSHGSEKKIVGVRGGLTNHPHVGKSTCDTPLDLPMTLTSFRGWEMSGRYEVGRQW